MASRNDRIDPDRLRTEHTAEDAYESMTFYSGGVPVQSGDPDGPDVVVGVATGELYYPPGTPRPAARSIYSDSDEI